MTQIRSIELTTDLPMLQRWWDGHKAIAVPEVFLPQGYLISSGGVDIAAAFLYVDIGGKLAMVEYLTTNPNVAFSRFLVDDVKYLLLHIEGVAVSRGCKGIISMVSPGTGEDRLMRRMGYIPPDGPPHVMFCKQLVKEGI